MAKKKKAATEGSTATLPTPKEPMPVVEAEITRCKKCDSTEREKYNRTIELPISGMRDGKPHTHVVYRYTRCANPACRQARIDKAFENRS